MSTRAAALLFTVLLASCGGRARPTGTAPSGGGTYTNQVRGYLARLESNARNQGYNRVAAGPVFGRLNDDARGSHEMTVVGGNSYVLFGACDNDCTDVDLRIYDTAGNMIMQDIALDDTPVLAFTASGSGRYRVEVIMATCVRNPCYYGVQLMAR